MSRREFLPSKESMKRMAEKLILHKIFLQHLQVDVRVLHILWAKFSPLNNYDHYNQIKTNQENDVIKSALEHIVNLWEIHSSDESESSIPIYWCIALWTVPLVSWGKPDLFRYHLEE